MHSIKRGGECLKIKYVIHDIYIFFNALTTKYIYIIYVHVEKIFI